MSRAQRLTAETPPRLVPTLALKAESCAAALDISPNSFRALVEEGVMPEPVTIPGHAGLVLWDFEAVRNAWQALLESAGDGKGNPWDRD